MTNIFKQEIFKIVHRKLFIYMPLVLFILMSLVALATRGNNGRFYIISAFAGFQWLVIIMIILSSSTISMEFQYGTIKKLITESNDKSSIFLSKWILMIFYSIFLHILSVIFTIILKFLIYGKQFPFGSGYLHSISLMSNLISNTIIDILVSIFIISAVFILAVATGTSAIAIATSLGFCFFGQGISNALISSIGKKIAIIKWNPFNMLNVANQWGNPDYFNITKLSQNELIIGNVVYIIIFIALGLIIFNKKNV